MKTTKFLTVLTAMGIAVTFLSCSKGDTGPQGPAGTNGTNGINGTNGVANINATTWIVTNWGWSSPSYYVTLSDANITSTVQSNGLVSVFASFDNGTTWYALPFTTYTSVEDAFWTDATQVGTLYVSFTWNDGDEDGSPNSYWSTSVLIKDVVVPPAMMVKHPNTNWKNLAEVAQLPEFQVVLGK